MSIGNKDILIFLGKLVKEKGNFNDLKFGEKENDKVDYRDDVVFDDNWFKEVVLE